MGFNGDPGAVRKSIRRERFWTAVAIGLHGPDSADAIAGILEACGLVPYVSAKPPKVRAEHSPAVKYPRVGQ